MLLKRILVSVLMVTAASGCRMQRGSDTEEETVLAGSAEIGTGEGLPRHDAYTGYLLAEKTWWPARLDLAPEAASGQKLRTRAVLKVWQGPVGSHEYYTFYWPELTFTPQELPKGVADTNSNAIVTFTGNSAGNLTGEIRLGESGTAYSFALTPGLDYPPPAKPKGTDGKETAIRAAPASRISGTYRGECVGSPQVLQIEASKWRGTAKGAEGPMSGYQVRGRSGTVDEFVCGKGTYCINEVYPSGLADPLRGSVKLAWLRSYKTCTLAPDQLVCSGCSMTRTTAEPAGLEAITAAPPAAVTALAAPVSDKERKPSKIRNFAGQYYGYLSLPDRGVHQLMAFNVTPAGTVKPSGKNVFDSFTAVATMYYGEGDSAEYTAYRFLQTKLPKKGQGLVLQSEGDVFLRVTRFNGEEIRGNWYSRHYGRAGTVFLSKGSVPQLPEGQKIVRRLTGTYESPAWDFEIIASSELGDQPDQFYPMRVYGWARERSDHARKRVIESVSYDIYTGHVALTLDDGRIALGRVTDDGLAVFWPPKPRSGTAIQTGAVLNFTKTGETVAPQARLTLPEIFPAEPQTGVVEIPAD